MYRTSHAGTDIHGASARLKSLGLDAKLATYIRLANSRDLQGLIDLYIAEPTLLMEGQPMRGDLATNMRTAVKAWTLLSAKFGPVRVLEERLPTADSTTAEVLMNIPSRGVLLVLPQRFDFKKRLQFHEHHGDWLISLDETVNAGVAGKALRALGMA